MKIPKLSTGMTTLLIALLVTALVVLAAGIIFLPDPLDAYTVNRQCTFIQFADLQAAACTDGTSWLVAPLNP